MNAEQKRRAERILSEWHDGKYSAARHGVEMASLLHELVDAAEEFESLTRNEDGTVTLKPGFKAVACTAQEALPATNPAQISSSAESVMCPGCEGAPANPNNPCAVCGKKAPSPSVPDELSGRFTDPVKLAYVDGWNACREAMLAATPTSADLDGPEFSDGCEKEGFPGGCERIGCCKPTPPEPPAELPTWENGDDPLVGGGLISRGVVDFATVGIWPTKPAPSVPDAGLVPVPRELLGAACYAIKKNLPAPKILEQLRRYALGGVTAPPAPSVPDGWRSAIAKEFPLFDEDGLDEDKHCCEWVMLQERKRLHKMIASTPTPAEAPADVARDAERYRWLRDKCRATGEHWGGRWSLVIEGPCPDGDKSSGAIDKAIDAAIKRQGGE
jgi:hypothetical protein